jgi:hypothetical protein
MRVNVFVLYVREEILYRKRIMFGVIKGKSMEESKEGYWGEPRKNKISQLKNPSIS